jgi:N-acetylglutamate synthase-like GNAT family acetyltransferase
MKTQQHIILPATLPDTHEIVALVNKAYRGETSKKGWTTEADLFGGIRTDKNGIEEILKDEDSTFLKYVDDKNNIIGCVHLQHKKQKLYVGMLTVDPEIQNKGIGKDLLQAADDYALKNNFQSVYMTVISIRKELIQWYERHGYKKTGETKPFPMNDEKFGLPKRFIEFIVLEKTV